MTLPSDQILLYPRDKDSALVTAIEDGVTLWDGAPATIGCADYTDADGRGYITNFKRAAGHKYRGRFSVSDLPPQYATDGTVNILKRVGSTTTVKGKVLIKGFQHYKVTVTGAAAKTDVNEYVWMTEDGLWTLTPPSIDTGFSCVPDGEIIDWITSTTCIVLEYSPEHKSAIEAAGGIFYYLSFHLDWTGVADGKLRNNFKMNHAGRIVEFFVENDIALTGAGGTLVVNASLSTVDITTAGITVITAGAQGARLSGTLLATSARETFFHQGDNLDIDISAAGGTRTLGKCTIYFRIMRRLGL